MKLKFHTIVVGPFQCNCSIIWDERSKEAIVIDPGDELENIQAELSKRGLVVKYAVHTHAHLDHIGAVKGLKAERGDMKIALHKEDEELYNNLPMQGQLFGIEYETPPPVDYFLQDEEVIPFANSEFSVVHTPGHSPGGVCLAFKEGELSDKPVLFSGDTLFHRSIGRTDLWGGDHSLLVKSIKDRLFRLDDQVCVKPGHGPDTSVGEEKSQNPFL